MGTRAVVGPFSLDLDDPLDKRIADLFGHISGRRKTATFREIMRGYFHTVDSDRNSTQADAINHLTKLVNTLLVHFDNGAIITPRKLDNHLSKTPSTTTRIDPLVTEAEKALDSLGGL